MSRTPLHDVAVVGAYNTPQAKKLDTTEIDCLIDAVNGALSSAGLGIADVDGVNVTSTMQRYTAREAVMLFGARPSWTGHDIGIPGVIEAALAISAGLCETAVVATAQVYAHRERKNTAPWTRPSNEFVECWGLFTPAEFALMARRHMHLYGTTPEQFAEVAATIRNNGARHPDACHYGKFVTPDDVLNSRMIADPFHLLDCAMTSEGGAGMVLTTAERAQDLDVRPIYLLGGGTDKQGMAYVSPPVWDKYGQVGKRAGKQAFAQAGLTPQDVDVLEIYDPFSFEIIRQLEIFGFCGEGEGGDFVMDGHLRMDGRFPAVTNGGVMSFSHAGLAQLLQKPISAVQQLRGEYPQELTVKDAKVALTSNGGSGALFTDVLLLGTQRPD
ncbi:MAG: thiolase family protein [Halioglobus sp.]|nr:thiolase family protein [Halioglobus sp.]